MLHQISDVYGLKAADLRYILINCYYAYLSHEANGEPARLLLLFDMLAMVRAVGFFNCYAYARWTGTPPNPLCILMSTRRVSSRFSPCVCALSPFYLAIRLCFACLSHCSSGRHQGITCHHPISLGVGFSLIKYARIFHSCTLHP